MKNALFVAACAVLFLASCAETDVVGQFASTSFSAMTTKLGVTEDEGLFQLKSPGGDVFSLAADFGRDNGMATMGAAGSAEVAPMESPDLDVEFDAAPFLAAGLDPAKLTKTAEVQYLIKEGRFMIHFEWGQTSFASAAAPATTVQGRLMDTFASILASYRDRIGYHEKLDHYGFALGQGNMVEWAKDLATNDKDLVFILDPAPLVAAGVDPAKVAGWVFAQVEVKDAAGKTVLVDKLLRPYNLDCLAKAGFTVVEAGDGRAGLAASPPYLFSCSPPRSPRKTNCAAFVTVPTTT